MFSVCKSPLPSLVFKTSRSLPSVNTSRWDTLHNHSASGSFSYFCQLFAPCVPAPLNSSSSARQSDQCPFTGYSVTSTKPMTFNLWHMNFWHAKARCFYGRTKTKKYYFILYYNINNYYYEKQVLRFGQYPVSRPVLCQVLRMHERNKLMWENCHSFRRVVKHGPCNWVLPRIDKNW